MSETLKNNDINKDIEKTFSTSNSPDELFDTFRLAIDQKIEDVDLYKILLWNKVLSSDELGMFSEKISKEFPNFSSEIYLAVANVLDSGSTYKNKELAFVYIKKAAAGKSSIKPYEIASELYNKELNLPDFDRIVNFMEEGFQYVEEKSRLSFIIAKLYGKVGDIEKGKSYKIKGEEYKMNGQ